MNCLTVHCFCRLTLSSDGSSKVSAILKLHSEQVHSYMYRYCVFCSTKELVYIEAGCLVYSAIEKYVFYPQCLTSSPPRNPSRRPQSKPESRAERSHDAQSHLHTTPSSPTRRRLFSSHGPRLQMGDIQDLRGMNHAASNRDSPQRPHLRPAPG